MNDVPSIGSGGIIFYGRDKCIDCDNAKEVLDGVGLKLGKDYIYRDVRQEPEAKKAVTSICEARNKSPCVPVIVFSPDLVFIEPREENLVDLQMAAMAKASLTREMSR